MTTLVTIHGIRTNANAWQEKFSRWCFDHCPRAWTAEYLWGWISATQMYLLTFVPCVEWRRRQKLAAYLHAQSSSEPGSRLSGISIIAHSKGTDLAVDTLFAFPELHLDALVLIAGVLDNRYHGSRLETVVNRGQVGRVLVLWSPNDDTIREFCVWPYGKLGATGYTDLTGAEAVWQRKTAEDHSTYFWSEFCEDHFRAIADFCLKGPPPAGSVGQPEVRP